MICDTAKHWHDRECTYFIYFHYFCNNTQVNRYPRELLENMFSRFEPPREGNRWDSPLLVCAPHCGGCAEDMIRSVFTDHLLPMLTPTVPGTKARAPVIPNRATQLTTIRPDDLQV